MRTFDLTNAVKRALDGLPVYHPDIVGPIKWDPEEACLFIDSDDSFGVEAWPEDGYAEAPVTDGGFAAAVQAAVEKATRDLREINVALQKSAEEARAGEARAVGANAVAQGEVQRLAADKNNLTAIIREVRAILTEGTEQAGNTAVVVVAQQRMADLKALKAVIGDLPTVNAQRDDIARLHVELRELRETNQENGRLTVALNRVGDERDLLKAEVERLRTLQTQGGTYTVTPGDVDVPTLRAFQDEVSRLQTALDDERASRRADGVGRDGTIAELRGEVQQLRSALAAAQEVGAQENERGAQNATTLFMAHQQALERAERAEEGWGVARNENERLRGELDRMITKAVEKSDAARAAEERAKEVEERLLWAEASLADTTKALDRVAAEKATAGDDADDLGSLRERLEAALQRNEGLRRDLARVTALVDRLRASGVSS